MNIRNKNNAGKNIVNMEESLWNATKNIESVLYSSTADGANYFFITDAIQKILGFSADDILENPGMIMHRIHPADFHIFKKFSRTLRSGIPATAEFRITDKNEKEHYIRNSGFPVQKDGAVIRIDGLINDITREKNIKEELEKSEERYRLLIETANDLIFDLDYYGYFLRVNNYGALALGYKPEEMTGRHFLEFVDDNNKSEVAIAFQRILKTRSVISFEVIFIDKFQKNIVFEIQGRPTKMSGKITGMLGIGRDITERRKDEEKLKDLNTKLIEANRLISIERDRAKQQISIIEEVTKLKNDFISNISHELRTPLASIVGFSETITSDPEMEKEMIMEFSQIILSEGKRLAVLINDLLDFAKLEGGKIEINKSEFDVIELLNKIAQDFSTKAEEKGLTLTAELPDTQVTIFADRERLQQVVVHLISNAVKFTGKGGRVALIAQNFNKEFEIIVSDTGIGISEKDLPKIFEKFYKAESSTAKVQGIGLGLGVVKHIIDMHKGFISVQSEIRKGTTFIIKLPKIIEINA